MRILFHPDDPPADPPDDPIDEALAAVTPPAPVPAAPVAVPAPVVPADTPEWAKQLLADHAQLRKDFDDKAKGEADRRTRRTEFKASEGKARAADQAAKHAKRSGARLFPDRK